MTTPLSPTDRTTVRRGRNRAQVDREPMHALLADALVAHVGVVVGDHPVVLPVAFAVDLDGPTRAAPSTSTARSPRGG
jgi:hypothetical protein